MSSFPDSASDANPASRRTSIWDWVVAPSGLAFIVLLVTSVIVGDADTEERNSDPGQAGAVIAQIFTERQDDVRQGAAIEVVAIFCFIAFIAYLYPKMRALGDDWTATITLGGGLVAAGYMLSVVNLELGTAAIEDYGQDTAVARALAAVTWDSILVLGAPLAALVTGVSVSALRHAFLPRWIGISGLPVVALLLILPAAFLGFMLFVPWIVLVSLALLWQLWSARSVAVNASGPIPQLS
jgi:hypothetical protein